MSVWNFFLSLGAHITVAAYIAVQLLLGIFNSPAQIVAPSATTSAPATPIAQIASTSIALAPIEVTATTTLTATEAPLKTSPPANQPIQPVSSPQTPATVTEDEINTQTRAALVNILCTTAAGGSFNPISGSGVIINSTGVVLTNAHVAQFFLLRDYPTPDNVNCVIRTGSPAQATYNAQLLYLPPAWIDANASQIGTSEEKGTGENDYAFLLITSTTDGTSLPATLPFIPINTEEPQNGDSVFLASYPAGFIDGSTIQTNLYATSALTTIQNIYTFATSTIDVISVGGTVVSQAGSSGGAVVRTQDGALIGIIATDTAGATTASRGLNAITLSYIDRSLRAQGHGGITSLLSGDLVQKVSNFNLSIAPGLTQQLVTALTASSSVSQ